MIRDKNPSRDFIIMSTIVITVILADVFDQINHISRDIYNVQTMKNIIVGIPYRSVGFGFIIFFVNKISHPISDNNVEKISS